MPLLTLPFPDINPVALWLGPFPVKWYGLTYAAGLLLGWTYVKQMLATPRLWLQDHAPFPPLKSDDLLLFMTFGVVLGGRLGEVFFYHPEFYLAHPAEIHKVWNGGMSFHGGFVGSIIAILAFARLNHVSPLTVLDIAAAATPIGLFLGRIANFINGELWGRPSTVAWSMVFPGAGPLPRHPSQLYEAALEGAALFVVCAWLIHQRQAFKRPGLVAGIFTAGYGLARAFCEFFREPETSHWANQGFMTPGILYSLPMIAVGLYFIYRARIEGRREAT